MILVGNLWSETGSSRGAANGGPIEVSFKKSRPIHDGGSFFLTAVG